MTNLLEIGLGNAVMALVLAVLAALLGRLLRRPAFTHGLWLVVLLKLVTPPLVAIPLPWPASQPPEAAFALVIPDEQPRAQADQPVLAAPAIQAEEPVQAPPTFVSAERSSDWLGSWGLPILCVWLAGSLCMFAGIIRAVFRFQRLLRFAVPADAGFQEMVAELAGKLKLARPPRAWLVEGIISPMLWALGGRPRLLFPAQLLGRLQPDQLRTIVLHELAHWRRRDHCVRFLELVVLVLYWWHPAVWWARSELHEAEEECCDAWVIATLEGADRTYALALLETVAFVSKARLPLPLPASGFGQVTHLRRRLTMIMSGQKRRSLTWAGCASLVALGFLLLPLAPIRAQQLRDKAPGYPDNIQVEDLRFIVQGDSPAVDKETIELLKRLLKLLEEKKGKTPAPASAAEIAKARDEVKTLTAAVGQKRQDLQVTEARQRQAQLRLAQLQGQLPGLPGQKGEGQPLHIFWKFQPDTKKPTPQGKIIWLELNQDGKKIKLPVTLPEPYGAKPEELKIFLRNPEGKSIRVPITLPVEKKLPASGYVPIRALPKQPEDLKSRLDRLLREVEELRREIQRSPSDGTKK